MSDSDKDVEAIIELERQRYAAIVAGDFDGFAAVCHPELMYTHSTGVTDSLDSYLAKCHEGFYVYHHVDHPVERIVVTGDAALVLGEMNADLTAGGVASSCGTRRGRLGARGRVLEADRLSAHPQSLIGRYPGPFGNRGPPRRPGRVQSFTRTALPHIGDSFRFAFFAGDPRQSWRPHRVRHGWKIQPWLSR
jgi:hypothetical protein